MISFLEMVQRYPIGAKIDLPRREGGKGPQEIVYESDKVLKSVSAVAFVSAIFTFTCRS